MNDSLHIVCPHCHTTNRVRTDQLGSEPSCGHCKKALFVAHSAALDEAAFDKHISRNQIPVLVDFWAPWCAPCVQEMPELSELAAGEEGKKLQVIGIGIDSPSNIAAFSDKYKITYPVLVAGMSGTDLSRQFGNTGGGLPYTVLIGADGQVKKTYLGRLKFDELRKDLATL